MSTCRVIDICLHLYISVSLFGMFSCHQEIVETATMKMVAAPVISVSVYFLFLHHWILVAALVGGGVCHMKKWSSKRNVSMCHAAVAEGIYIDTRNFALQRWQDLQAMQVAIRRLRSEEAIRILKVCSVMSFGRGIRGLSFSRGKAHAAFVHNPTQDTKYITSTSTITTYPPRATTHPIHDDTQITRQHATIHNNM